MRRFSRHFRSCFEHIRDPMLIVDGEGNIRASNAAARAALDLGEKGRVWEITWLDRRVSLDGGSIVPLLKGSAAVLGRRLYDTEGNESDVVLDILDLSGKKSGGGPKLVHIKDYSPYTNYERWKDELLSMAAHEIKNPLAAMKSSMNVLMSNAADAMTKGQRDLLGVSLRSIDRLTRLLDNVLDVSSIRSGGYAPEPRWIGAREFTAEVIGAFKTLFNVERQRLGYVVSGDLDRVYVDAPKLEQILVNLLTNAVKFTQEGGDITVHVEPAGLEVLGDDLRILPWGDIANLKFVRFAVTDTGIGMTGEMLSHLFTRHYRNKGRGGPKGSHLGLSISKALVEAQNGTLDCQSELGVGTTVTVSLPADETTSTLLGRVRSIDRVLAGFLGLRRGVACHAFRKEDPLLPWDRAIVTAGAGFVVNPTMDEEKSGGAFAWTLTPRVAVGLVAEETIGRRPAARLDEEDRWTRLGEGCTVTSRMLAPKDARIARLLAFAFKSSEEGAGVR